MCGPGESKPNLTHSPSVRNNKDTYRIFEKITSSESQKEKRIFFSSNKLFNKPLIHAVSLPSGTTEYPVQYRLNFKGKLLQLPLLFPWCQSRCRCHLVIYFTATKAKKIKHTFLKGQTLHIHLLQGSIGHQTQRVSGKTVNEGSQSVSSCS